MRWFPKSIPVLVVAIALYFVLYFGMDAFRILSSPFYGLGQADFSRMVHGVSRYAVLNWLTPVQVAAFIGAIKLAISVLFALYLASRVRMLLGRETEHEVVDAAVVLIVTVTVIAATPALLAGDMHLLSQYRLPLWLAGLIATLSMIERAVAEGKLQLSPEKTARGSIQGVGVALPRRRYGVSSQRWDALRRSANMDLDADITVRPLRIFR